jgi:hypothetical protein
VTGCANDPIAVCGAPVIPTIPVWALSLLTVLVVTAGGLLLKHPAVLR